MTTLIVIIFASYCSGVAAAIAFGWAYGDDDEMPERLFAALVWPLVVPFVIGAMAVKIINDWRQLYRRLKSDDEGI